MIIIISFIYKSTNTDDTAVNNADIAVVNHCTVAVTDTAIITTSRTITYLTITTAATTTIPITTAVEKKTITVHFIFLIFFNIISIIHTIAYTGNIIIANTSGGIAANNRIVITAPTMKTIEENIVANMVNMNIYITPRSCSKLCFYSYSHYLPSTTTH